jgi:hypothetical protein
MIAFMVVHGVPNPLDLQSWVVANAPTCRAKTIGNITYLAFPDEYDAVTFRIVWGCGRILFDPLFKIVYLGKV